MMTLIRYVLIFVSVLCGVALMALNETFGDYRITSYDIILNMITVVVYLIAAVSFLALFGKRASMKFYLLFTLPFFVVLFFVIWGNNFHKSEFMEAKLESFFGSALILFDNGSFEIEKRTPHLIYVFKGKYRIDDKMLELKKENLIDQTDSLFTIKYLISENGVLAPVGDSTFEPLVISENLD